MWPMNAATASRSLTDVDLQASLIALVANCAACCVTVRMLICPWTSPSRGSEEEALSSASTACRRVIQASPPLSFLMRPMHDAIASMAYSRMEMLSAIARTWVRVVLAMAGSVVSPTRTRPNGLSLPYATRIKILVNVKD